MEIACRELRFSELRFKKLLSTNNWYRCIAICSIYITLFYALTGSFFQVFFVLRKKNSHISTLHVIHHGVMPMSVWFGVKFTPGKISLFCRDWLFNWSVLGGHSTFFGFLNTFVHIVMYTYYLLAAFGPHMQKYLWWKKYLTTLQMVNTTVVLRTSY